jgi:hypothetical protein
MYCSISAFVVSESMRVGIMAAFTNGSFLLQDVSKSKTKQQVAIFNRLGIYILG